MNIFAKLAVTLVAGGMLSACVTTKTYVDPQYHVANYDQIQHLAQPVPVRVEARFERNGQPYASVDAGLRQMVERTLYATGAFRASPDASGGAVIEVVANNVADIEAAHEKGFRAGLTLGTNGSNVPDAYDFTFVYHDASGNEQRKSYHHTIYTTLGQVPAPVTGAATTTPLAFEKVVEDVTLNFVKALQDDGGIANH